MTKLDDVMQADLAGTLERYRDEAATPVPPSSNEHTKLLTDLAAALRRGKASKPVLDEANREYARLAAIDASGTLPRLLERAIAQLS